MIFGGSGDEEGMREIQEIVGGDMKEKHRGCQSLPPNHQVLAHERVQPMVDWLAIAEMGEDAMKKRRDVCEYMLQNARGVQPLHLHRPAKKVASDEMRE